LTFHGRLLIVRRHLNGWKQARIAAATGISRRCVKTWIDRYAAEGEAGLHDRSSRPDTSPRRTGAEPGQRIIALRRRERRGGIRQGRAWARERPSCKDRILTSQESTEPGGSPCEHGRF
jgi:hypothetical protein